MFCEAYNRSLRDAATSGEALTPALQQHLASCASCHDAFAEEQSLFAALDAGLNVTANSEVPTTLIPRVRVAIHNEPAPQGHNFNFFFWSFAGASVTAAVVLALLYLPHKRTTLPAESSPTVAVGTTQASSNPMQLNPVRTGGVSTLQHRKIAVLAGSKDAKPELPEVLVPNEERVAFAQFMANASPSSATVSAKAGLLPRAPESSVQISPVEIASLELRPLDEKEGRQGQF